ncbi:TPA: hypothetical protein ACUT5Z_004683, partial [Pseudomonas aeruginosa]
KYVQALGRATTNRPDNCRAGTFSMLGEAVVRVVDLSQDGFSEQHRRSAHLQRECARRRWHSSAHRTSERRRKKLAAQGEAPAGEHGNCPGKVDGNYSLNNREVHTSNLEVNCMEPSMHYTDDGFYYKSKLAKTSKRGRDARVP